MGSAIFRLTSPQLWNQKLESLALKYSVDQATDLTCTIYDPYYPNGIKKNGSMI